MLAAPRGGLIFMCYFTIFGQYFLQWLDVKRSAWLYNLSTPTHLYLDFSCKLGDWFMILVAPLCSWGNYIPRSTASRVWPMHCHPLISAALHCWLPHNGEIIPSTSCSNSPLSLWNVLVPNHKIIHNQVNLEATQLFKFSRRPALRRSSLRLLQQTGRTRRRSSFACRVVKYWNRSSNPNRPECTCYAATRFPRRWRPFKGCRPNRRSRSS